MPEKERKITDNIDLKGLINILGKKPTKEYQPQCSTDFSIDHAVGITTLKMNCEGCKHKSSFFDIVCRKQLITKLIENPVDKIEFVRRLTTEEYQKDDVEIIKEISDIVINVIGAPFGIFHAGCGECADKRRMFQESIIYSLKNDPINTYRQLGILIKGMEKYSKEESECTKCLNLGINTLNYIKRSLKDTVLIRKAEGYPNISTTEIYKKIFISHVRPFLSESRIVLELPSDAKQLGEGYEVADAKVRLYRVPSWNEDLYFIIPPEYELRHRPEMLELLMQTREWLLRNVADQIKSTDTSENTKKKFEVLCKVKLSEIASQNRLVLTTQEINSLVTILIRCTRGLDVIELLLRDPDIQDVYVNSPMETTPVYVKHKDFDDCRTNIYLSEESGNNFVLKFVLQSGIGLSPNSPILDMELEELRTRVSVVAPPLSPDGIAFSLRCRKDIPWTLPMFVENHMMSALGAGLLTFMVNDQVALLVVGGRGTGKSSFLGGLMTAMNPKHRVLTLEDTLELSVPELNNAGFRVQRMLVQPVTTSEGLSITADDALRSSLRMGESSIVVGEVRGPEAKVLYESIRVGATGNTVLGTIHGRGPQDIFERVVYDLGIPATSFKATDVVVVTGRLPVGRRVVEIAELNKDVDIENIHSGAESSKLFNTLMMYDSRTDQLRFPHKFKPSESFVVRTVANRRGITPEHAWEDVKVRARMYENIVGWYRELDAPEILEIKTFVDLNKKYVSFVDDQRQMNKGKYEKVEYDYIYDKWVNWAGDYIEGIVKNRK